MILKEVLTKSTSFLKAKNIEGARWEVEALLAHGLGWERVQLYMKSDYPLNQEELQRCRELIQNRGRGVPTAYLVGYKNFFKTRFQIQPGVLIPRSDSEVLVEQLLAVLPMDSNEVVMDWGCGSGCLGLSLLLERPELKLIAVDADLKAIEQTKRNAELLGLSDRTHLVHSEVEQLNPRDMLSSGSEACFLIANPPYISENSEHVEESVREHEPSLALFSGEEGLSHLKGWVSKALMDFPKLNHMIFEIGFDQAYAMRDFVAHQAGSVSPKIFKDLGGRDRALMLSR